MQTLLTGLHIFLMIQVGRICFNIKTFNLWSFLFLHSHHQHVGSCRDNVRKNQMLVTLGARVRNHSYNINELQGTDYGKRLSYAVNLKVL